MNIAKIICTNTFLLLYTSKHRAWFGSWTSHCQIRATYIQALGADVTKPRHFRIVRHIFDILCFQIIYLELQKNPKKLTKETEFTCDLGGQFRISRNPFRRLAPYLCVKPIVLSRSTVELCDRGRWPSTVCVTGDGGSITDDQLGCSAWAIISIAGHNIAWARAQCTASVRAEEGEEERSPVWRLSDRLSVGRPARKTRLENTSPVTALWLLLASCHPPC